MRSTPSTTSTRVSVENVQESFLPEAATAAKEWQSVTAVNLTNADNESQQTTTSQQAVNVAMAFARGVDGFLGKIKYALLNYPIQSATTVVSLLAAGGLLGAGIQQLRSQGGRCSDVQPFTFFPNGSQPFSIYRPAENGMFKSCFSYNGTNEEGATQYSVNLASCCESPKDTLKDSFMLLCNTDNTSTLSKGKTTI